MCRLVSRVDFFDDDVDSGGPGVVVRSVRPLDRSIDDDDDDDDDDGR